jgi:hypothetical protein
MQLAAVSPQLRSTDALQAQIDAQNEIGRLLHKQLQDLRISRDAWRIQAEAAQHLLVDGRPHGVLLGPSSAIRGASALFKRCVLPILLAAIVLVPSNLIPVSQATIDAALRCLVPAFQRLSFPTERIGISHLQFVEPAYTAEDRDYLIKTIAFEAGGESDQGKAAVAHVILTRKRSGRWGDTIKKVVTYPWQFESWMTRRAEIERLVSEDYRYRSAARIADAVLAGQMPDPTTGATHFLNPMVVHQRLAGSLPAWAAGGGLSIGSHTFYAPDAVAWAAKVTRPAAISCWSEFSR